MRPEPAETALGGPGGVTVAVKLLHASARLPERAYEHDAAYDLHAAEELVIEPLGRGVVGTGIALGLPPGLAALTLPRSGLAARHGISIVNAPGLIDPGYRGEIRVILLNTARDEAFHVAVGDRIAQLLFMPLAKVALAPVLELDQTERGPQGFGSSGRAGEGMTEAAARDPAPDVPGSTDKPTIRVAGLLVHDGRILMVEQGRGEERYWLLPGGGVKFGETLADALRREFDEELSLRVGVNRLLAIVESISPDPDYAKHVVHLVFEVSAPHDEIPQPSDVNVLKAAFLDEIQLQSADVRPPITEFLSACVREIPSSPQYLGRRW